ncbi:MAG: DinB family protein [Chitinophagaceae bacterium]
MSRPDLSRVPEPFHKYINQAKHDDVLKAIDKNGKDFLKLMKSIPKNKYVYAYGEGKWTLKEVFQHIIDAERVFAYRAVCIARGEQQSLPGFDENDYAAHSKANARDWDDMIEEFKHVRKSTSWLFRSFDNEQLDANGISNQTPVYVLAFGFIIPGHCQHHMKIIKERYL